MLSSGRTDVRSAGVSVRPASLTDVASRLLATAAELREARSDVTFVAELAAHGLAVPVVATSATGLARAWGDAVDGEADVLDHLAASLRGSSRSYDDLEARLARPSR